MNTSSISQFAGQINTMIEDDFIVAIYDAVDSLPVEEPDFVTPDMLGELDAQEGALCLPEIYYADRIKCALYAAGWASVNGPSLLSDYWLVGSTVEAIEDDNDWYARGQW